jgi:radical SAM protein with 4Fe4S-binding SPASM domain
LQFNKREGKFESMSQYGAPKKVVIGIEEGVCNLKCPKCFVHGNNNSSDLKGAASKGRMDKSDILKILHELLPFKPQLVPITWSEPFMFKDIEFFVREAKKMGFPVSIHTNGVLLNSHTVNYILETSLDAMCFSIDAFSSDVFEITRGTKHYQVVVDNVFKMLEARGDGVLPRIGVSFTVDEHNSFQKDDFIKYWLEHVDYVRVNETYGHDRKLNNITPEISNEPCREIFDQLVISYDGSVRICCLDAFREIEIGNVLKDGVMKVWDGEVFNNIRKMHLDGKIREYDFCKNCDLNYAFMVTDEENDGKILTRKSLAITFYNRLDRIESWNQDLKRRDSK